MLNKPAICGSAYNTCMTRRSTSANPTTISHRCANCQSQSTSASTKKKLVRLRKPRLPSALGLSGACGVEA
eukprot:scaffold14697_cov129-Isochrysis_galbana.AAC.1